MWRSGSAECRNGDSTWGGPPARPATSNNDWAGRRPAHMIRPICLLLLMAASLPAAPFEVTEATIAQVHDAMRAGTLTCRELVAQYLKRIDAYDKNGPAINSIVV